MRKVGISIISLLPWSWGHWGVRHMSAFSRIFNLNLQLVPLVGWGGDSLSKIDHEKVISYEGAWSISRKIMLQKILLAHFPAFFEFPLFGTMKGIDRKTYCFHNFFPKAIPIDLPWGIKEIVKRNPWENSDYYKNTPGPFVFDTWHIRKDGLEKPVSLFKSLLRNNKIALLHLQTRRETEFVEFISQKEKTFLDQILWELKIAGRDDIGIIIELPPSFLWRDMAAKIAVIKKIINK